MALSGQERAALETWKETEPAAGFGVTAKKKARAKRKLSPIEALEDSLQPYLAAFWQLHRTRSYSGFGYPSGLSLVEIRAYLDEYEIEGAERRRHLRFLAALDAEFLRISAEQLKRSATKK